MKVLSLFDGMACGRIAFDKLGIKVDQYYAYEIDKYAIQVATHNYPDIIECGDVFKADFTQYNGIDWLIGGSPCTYWSIAQKNNRETEASGLGWELFSQYVRALHEARPKYFIYENNKSMSKQIRASIDETFGFEAVGINSALVSAQNRQRLYWVGIRQSDGSYKKANIEQPIDKGILLKDILESGVIDKEKSYCLKHQAGNSRDYFKKHHTQIAYEPVRIPPYGNNDKARPINALYPNNAGLSFEKRIYSDNPNKQQIDYIAEPIRIGDIGSNSQAHRVYSAEGKSVTINAGGGGQGGKTGLYACPIEAPAILRYERTEEAKKVRKDYESGKVKHGFHELHELHPRADRKSNTLSTVQKDNMLIEGWDGKTYPVYTVQNGLITIKDKQYPIKLADGYYIIRKLSVNECKRLQTVPEWYDMSVISNSQAYKCLGNGWTVDVICHLIKSSLEIINA